MSAKETTSVLQAININLRDSGYLFADLNQEDKIKAALERKIFSIDDICGAGQLIRFHVETVSFTHFPNDHQDNMARQSTATPEELADLKDLLRLAITVK